MSDHEFDIPSEVSRVRRESVAFRDVCLSALLEPAGGAG
jgi:hypothetical protein